VYVSLAQSAGVASRGTSFWLRLSPDRASERRGRKSGVDYECCENRKTASRARALPLLW